MVVLNQAPPPAINCSVIREDVGTQLRVRGRVIAATRVQGSYSLRVRKTVRSGSSVASQAGSFTAAPNEETFVGLASFNQEKNASYDVQLTLRVGDQTYECKSDAGAL